MNTYKVRRKNTFHEIDFYAEHVKWFSSSNELHLYNGDKIIGAVHDVEFWYQDLNQKSQEETP